MKDNCLDIGIIQAFLDGELEHSQTARVSGHIAICDVCAVMLAEAEDESAVVFSALEREFDTLVPTQRLWSKINASITTERENRPFWEKAYAFLAASLLNPSIAAAAGLLIVAGLFAAVWVNRSAVPADIVATSPQTQVSTPTQPVPQTVPFSNDTAGDSTFEPKTPAFRVERASYRTETRPDASPAARPVAEAPGYLPGEESYIRSITSLARTVDEQKAGGIMRPGERIAYERDMAVVDDTIAKMRKEVKRNPKNESAKQVLYSSYQNKIDLLNSVSQKEELVASMK